VHGGPAPGCLSRSMFQEIVSGPEHVKVYRLPLFHLKSVMLDFIAKNATARKVNSYTTHSPFRTAHFVSKNTLF